jgi:large subunit ribosomal protein L22
MTKVKETVAATSKYIRISPTNNFDLEKENLIITEAYVNQGPILKRVRPRAQGRAFAIQKKMSHVTIKVAEV